MLDDIDDPWSYAAYKAHMNAHQQKLASLHNTCSGSVWLCGNGPSLTYIDCAINMSKLPKLGVNKTLGLIWPLDYAVLCHIDHLDEPITYETSGALFVISEKEADRRWRDLEARSALFMHGSSTARGISIPISHDELFSTDLVRGACEGTAATGGSVMLIAMQLAYWLGYRKFLCAGFELAGGKFYRSQIFDQRALDGQIRLFKLIAPVLTSLGVECVLVEPGASCRNVAFPSISLSEV